MSLKIIVYYAEQGPSQVMARDEVLPWDVLKSNIVIPPGKMLSNLLFTYQDEENDRIIGTTELEWNTLCKLLNTKKVIMVDVYPVFEDPKNKFKSINLGKTWLEKSSNTKKDSCDKWLADKQSKEKHFNLVKEKFGRSERWGYKDVSQIQSPEKKSVNPLLPEYSYTGKALQAVALPLGPLGGGCIAVAGDGGLRQWQISNKVSHTAQVPDSFFAIRIKKDKEDAAWALQCDALYDTSKFKPAPYITDHVVPQASINLLKTVPGVSDVKITAKYPVVEVDYKVCDYVDVHLEAWNPKIPLNSKDSGIPVIVFDFRVTNKCPDPIEVSLLASLQNIVGWNGYDTIFEEVRCNGYGGNINSLYTTDSLYAIDMTNPTLASNHPFFGHVAIAALTGNGSTFSTMVQYDNVKALWKNFKTQLPGQGMTGPSKAGSTFNGAICNKVDISSGAETTFTFMLAWHFPNRYRDWNFGVSIPNTRIYVGNYYAKFWDSIKEVLEYVSSNLLDLRTTTYSFRNAMFESSLPWQLIDSAAGRVSVLNSPTCMWHTDGFFYAFEGCQQTSGCCPLNCTHVWNYEMALAVLYPDLERSMREIDLLHQITPHGEVPSRTTCPLELRRQWVTWKNFTADPTSTDICVDGQIGTVLKTYREIRNGASRKWFDQVWPSIKLIMNHWLNVLDTEKNGLLYGPQPSTYDVPLYGYVTNIGCLYLCGLRAAEEMARLQDEDELARIYSDRFALGSKNLDEKCFTNGKWYTHHVDPNHLANVLTTSTFIGALYGQWWAHYLGLGYLLPREHIRSHLKYTYQRNYVDSFTPDVVQAPRKFCDSRDSGWKMAVWDEGTIPKHPLRYSQEASWSGILYPFAALLLSEGMIDEGLKVLEVTRCQYDGTRRSPWNDVECGDHYARPMSAFSLFQLACGQVWSFTSDTSVHLSFKPIYKSDSFRSFFILATCWGSYIQSRNNVMVELSYGKLKLATLKFPTDKSSFPKGNFEETVIILIKKNKVKITKNPEQTKIYNFNFTVESGIVFENAIHLEEGEVLSIRW